MNADKNLRIAGYRGGVFGASFAGGAFPIAAFAVGIQGVGGEVVGFAPFADGGPDVGGEGILQALFGVHQRGVGLVARQGFAIHQGGLGVEFLGGDGGLDHLFDLVLQVVTLVDHVGDFGAAAGLPFEERDFVKNAEDLVGIDGAQREVVIGVAAVVEVEAAQHVFGEQPGHDLFDVLGLIMMAGIDQDFGLRAGIARHEQRHAPIGDVGVIEGGFERLVLDQEALVGLEMAVGFDETFFEPAAAMPDVGGAGIAGAVGEPQRNVPAASGAGYFDAVENV